MHISSTAESDFFSLSESVTLSPTTTKRCVSVNIVQDSLLEEAEYLTVSLSFTNEQSSVLISQQNATIYIIDDDGELEHIHKFLRITNKTRGTCTSYIMYNLLLIETMHHCMHDNSNTD